MLFRNPRAVARVLSVVSTMNRCAFTMAAGPTYFWSDQ